MEQVFVAFEPVRIAGIDVSLDKGFDQSSDRIREPNSGRSFRRVYSVRSQKNVRKFPIGPILVNDHR